MSLSLYELGELVKLTVLDPRRGLRTVLDANPSMAARVMALVLMSVASTLIFQLSVHLAPPPVEVPLITMLREAPIATALSQGVVMLATAALVHVIGRMAGGTGQASDALLAMVWMQAVFLALQIVQTLLLIALPPVGVILSLAALGFFFWILTNFVAEVHGFASVGKVFLGIIATLLVLSFVLVQLAGPEAFGHV